MNAKASMNVSSGFSFNTLSSELQARFGPHLRLKCNVPGAALTTFALGGIVPLVVEPADLQTLAELVQSFRSKGLPWRVIGAGSNVVISDNGVEEVLIHLGKEFGGAVFLEQHRIKPAGMSLSTEIPATLPDSLRDSAYGEDVHMLACGGCSLMSLSRKMSSLGLSGLEFAAGIPASLGGAVAMNAGAHGHDLSEVVSNVVVMDSNGEVQVLSRNEMAFSYRHSSVAPGMVVVAATLKLARAEREGVLMERTRCLDYRKRTQPLHLPSAGSVFRNPVPESTEEGQAVYAAELLERVGLKGVSHGGVSFSSMHSNWLVKIAENARAEEVVSLIKLGKSKVREECAVDLRAEIIIW